MKIRASVLTQVLAVLTVAALVGTGIVLGQSRRGDTRAVLLDSMPALAVAAATGAAAVTQPTAQDNPVVQSTSGRAPGPVRPSTATPPTTPPVSPSTTDDTEPDLDEPDDDVDNPDDDFDEPEVEKDEAEEVDEVEEEDEPEHGETEDD